LLGQLRFARDVERRAILRILPVAQRLRDRNRQRERTRQLVREQARFEIARDRGVVFGGAFVGTRRKAAARVAIAAARQRGDRFGILFGIAEHADALEVLRRGAQERNAADVDLLDRFVQRRAVARDGLLERIEVDDDGRDQRDAIRFRFGLVRRVARVAQDAAEDVRVQRLHATVEHRWETGELLDVAHVEAGSAQVRRGAAGGVDDRSRGGQRAGEFDDAVPVVDRNQRRSSIIRQP
jgi:hypothetical protein